MRCRECHKEIKEPKNHADQLAQRRGFCRAACEEAYDTGKDSLMKIWGVR